LFIEEDIMLVVVGMDMVETTGIARGNEYWKEFKREDCEGERDCVLLGFTLSESC
jgi:hypothetical protein